MEVDFNILTETISPLPISLLWKFAGRHERDSLGQLWIISGGVLHKYVHADSTYLSFDLPDLENSGGVKGICIKMKWNTLCGGPDYFIQFDPAVIEAVHPSTDILFTDSGF